MRQQLSHITKNKLVSKVPRKLQQFFVEVVLGRASANCKHLGICKMESVSTRYVLDRLTKPNICGRAVYALASYQPHTFLELAFLQTSLDTNTRKRYFSNDYFIVEENYTVQMTTMIQAFRIKTGIYPIIYSDTLMTVRFYEN